MCLDCGRILKHTWYVDPLSFNDNQPYEQYAYTPSYKRLFHYSEKIKQLFGYASAVDRTVLETIAKNAVAKFGTKKCLTRKQITQLCREVKRNRLGLQYCYLRTYLDEKDFVPVKPAPDVLCRLELYFLRLETYFDQIRSDLGRKNLVSYDFIIEKLLEKLDPEGLPKYKHVFKSLKMAAKKEQLNKSWMALIKAYKDDWTNRHDTLFNAEA